MGEGTDGRGAESRMAAPGRAGDGTGDFLLSEAGRSPVLDAAQLEVLRSYGTERDVAAGDVLFADGEETYDLIVMLDGTAEIIQGYGQPSATLIAGYGRPGIFAVGDVRAGSVKRAATAIGEGSMAVRLVFDRLQFAGTTDAISSSAPAHLAL